MANRDFIPRRMFHQSSYHHQKILFSFCGKASLVLDHVKFRLDANVGLKSWFTAVYFQRIKYCKDSLENLVDFRWCKSFSCIHLEGVVKFAYKYTILGRV